MPRLRSCLAALLLAPAAVGAQDAAAPWRVLGDWTVVYDAASGGCRTEREFGSTAFSIGFEKTGAQTVIVVRLSDPGWMPAPADAMTEVEASFGRQSPWTLEMAGEKVDGAPGLRLTVPTTARMAGLFIDEFKREAAMVWRLEGTALGEYSLLGSRNAFDAVVQCQTENEGF